MRSRPAALLTALVALLLLPRAPLAAQAPSGRWLVQAAAGMAWQPDTDEGHLAVHGGHAAAAVQGRLARGHPVALRLEGLASAFRWASDHVHGPCRPDEPPEACHPRTGPVRLRAITMAALHAPAAGRSWVGMGGGWYQLAAHPREGRQGRAGAYAVVGRRVAGARPALSIEAQLHWLPGLDDAGAWHLPMRLALAF